MIVLFKPNFNDHGKSGRWNMKFVLYLFLALLKFDKPELEYLISGKLDNEKC